MDEIVEIKKLLKEERLVMGKDEVLKGLRGSSVKKVFMAKNTPEDLKQDVNHYAEIAGVEVVELKQDNAELGDICKRPHYIAVLAVKA